MAEKARDGSDGRSDGRGRYHGKLELTWTNKDQSLLAHEDGSYAWLPPPDYRVAEVRLLRDATTVGEVRADSARAKDNLLIRGDALHALTSLLEIPEFAREYAGKVKLIYLDPPFNTQQAFEHYDDALEHSVWLTMMRDRLEQVEKLLSADGSIWVHCDDSEQAYLKCVMDEVFGRENFIASVIWEKADSPRMDAKLFSARHDYILVFRKGDAFSLNRLDATDEGHAKYTDDQGRRYYLNPLRARGRQATRADRPNLYFPLVAPDGTEVYPKLPSGEDGRWRWSKERVERDADILDWRKGKKGWTAYYRIFEAEERTRPPETIWPHTEVGSNRTSANEIKKLLDGLAYSTPKPEALLQRVLQIGSDPGDIVLDCFAGSGTTASVAHKMERRWVTVEWSREVVETYVVPRLSKVVAGDDLGGVTESTGWEGGGGFRLLEVAPSMFAEDEGMVVLAEWAVGGELGEATAAQLGYDFEPAPPFVGRKGRARLAVIDGLVNADVARILVGALGDGERLVLCATAVDPATRDVLRELRPGSTVRKIPASILAEYKLEQRWHRPKPLRELVARDGAGNGTRAPVKAAKS
jgi:adenine-specific DNA-methyltransferase